MYVTLNNNRVTPYIFLKEWQFFNDNYAKFSRTIFISAGFRKIRKETRAKVFQRGL